MREHYCANCDYCRRNYKGYEYYCLKWDKETDFLIYVGSFLTKNNIYIYKKNKRKEN